MLTHPLIIPPLFTFPLRPFPSLICCFARKIFLHSVCSGIADRLDISIKVRQFSYCRKSMAVSKTSDVFNTSAIQTHDALNWSVRVCLSVSRSLSLCVCVFRHGFRLETSSVRVWVRSVPFRSVLFFFLPWFYRNVCYEQKPIFTCAVNLSTSIDNGIRWKLHLQHR